MSQQKYTMPEQASSLPRTITSDRFLAAFLLSQGYELDKVVENERRRVGFVFVGDGVKECKRIFRERPVLVDMRSFRRNLDTVYSHVHEKRRRASCPTRGSLIS